MRQAGRDLLLLEAKFLFDKSIMIYDIDIIHVLHERLKLLKLRVYGECAL